MFCRFVASPAQGRGYGRALFSCRPIRCRGIDGRAITVAQRRRRRSRRSLMTSPRIASQLQIRLFPLWRLVESSRRAHTRGVKGGPALLHAGTESCFYTRIRRPACRRDDRRAVASEQRELKPVRLNNRVRNALVTAFGTVMLSSRDIGRRTDAAQSIFKSRDAAALPALDERHDEGKRQRRQISHGAGRRGADRVEDRRNRR